MGKIRLKMYIIRLNTEMATEDDGKLEGQEKLSGGRCRQKNDR